MNKLVRDNIPSIIQSEKPKVLEFHKIENDEEFLEILKDKVIEEANELKEALTIQRTIEEFADLFEVVDTLFTHLAKMYPGSLDTVHNIRRNKNEALGTFEQRYFIDKYEV